MNIKEIGKMARGNFSLAGPLIKKYFKNVYKHSNIKINYNIDPLKTKTENKITAMQ